MGSPGAAGIGSDIDAPMRHVDSVNPGPRGPGGCKALVSIRGCEHQGEKSPGEQEHRLLSIHIARVLCEPFYGPLFTSPKWE